MHLLALLIVIAALVVLSGCVRMPSRTQPWCGPMAKIKVHDHGGMVGVRCWW